MILICGVGSVGAVRVGRWGEGGGAGGYQGNQIVCLTPTPIHMLQLDKMKVINVSPINLWF